MREFEVFDKFLKKDKILLSNESPQFRLIIVEARNKKFKQGFSIGKGEYSKFEYSPKMKGYPQCGYNHM